MPENHPKKVKHNRTVDGFQNPAFTTKDDELIPIISRGFKAHPRWLDRRISEASTSYQTAKHFDLLVSRPRLIYKICLTSHQRHAKDGAFDG